MVHCGDDHVCGGTGAPCSDGLAQQHCVSGVCCGFGLQAQCCAVGQECHAETDACCTRSCAGKACGEDDGARGEKELDALTHKYTAQVDELVKHKEAELLEV